MTTPESPPPPETPPEILAKDRLQDKADILESNLFNTISKQKDPTRLQVQIDRKQFPDPVVIKALLQLLPRVNIKAPKLLVFLRKLLLRSIPEGDEIKLKKQLLSLAKTDKPELTHLGVTMAVQISNQMLTVVIRGVPPVPSKDGAIEKAFFDHEGCAGMLRKDGGIDFREINKFPIVKAGDNLFFITPEVQGRSGMGFDGKIIPVPQALPLSFNLKDGVDTVDSLDEKGNKRGYFLRASKTGVVILTRSEEKITEIEIRNTLDVNRLDYSTGNIGTKFVCPISMKIDTICNGFSIRAMGMVEVGELEGGEVETDSHAIIHSAHPESKVMAKKDIVTHFAKNASLTSRQGNISISDEAVDTDLSAVGINFEKTKGIFTSNTLDGEHIVLKGLYLCGENSLYFGRRLFSEKQEFINARQTLEEEDQALDQKETDLMEGLHNDIKQLTKTLKRNPLLRDNLRAYILATQKMEYKILYKELETIGQTMNTKEVINMKKLLDALRQIPSEKQDIKDKDNALISSINRKERDMSGMVLTVEGFLRRAATLKIFTGENALENLDKPDIFIESKKDKDTLIKIQGSYNKNQGFKITQE